MPFKATRMDEENVFNLSLLKKNFQQKYTKTKVNNRSCVQLSFTTQPYNQVYEYIFSETYSGIMQEISLAKGGRAENVSKFGGVQRNYLKPLR